MSTSIWHWMWRLDILLVLRFSVFQMCHANIILTSNIDIESQGVVIKTQCLLKVVRLTSTMFNSSCDTKCLKFNDCSKLELDVTTMLCFDIYSSVWISNTKPEIDCQTLKLDGKQTFWRFLCQLHFHFQTKFDAYPTLELDINQTAGLQHISPTFGVQRLSGCYFDIKCQLGLVRNVWVYILFAGLVSW